jgi:two-component system cell cycle sensor histidine kinase/response regulator CckA
MTNLATDRRLNILVAEDDECLAELTAIMLECRGHIVMTVPDGLRALHAAEFDGPFDVLVTDVNMPLMDGRALVRQLRERQPALPVVVVTGNASKQVSADFAAIGGSVLVMQKPVDHDRLAYEVERVAAEARARLSPQPV